MVRERALMRMQTAALPETTRTTRFWSGTVTFTLIVPGVTVNSTFSNVVVQFGMTATPPQTQEVPEPASMLLLGSGLARLAAGFRRRFAKK